MGSEIFTTSIVGLICTILSSVATFLLTRRRYNTEVDNQQIQNMKDAFEGYKRIVQNTIDAQNRKIKALEEENASLRTQLTMVQQQVLSLLSGKSIGAATPHADKPDGNQEHEHEDIEDI